MNHDEKTFDSGMFDLLTQNFDLADDVSGRHNEPLVEDASGPVELTRDLDEG
jgi:hypothetical protein